MAQIILDLGSGNSDLNNKETIKRTINAINEIDTGLHEIIIKAQLFEQAGKNVPLQHFAFDYAYAYGKKMGYEVTSSVFDKHSLDFLLQYDVPFIKIANNEKLYHLIDEIPRGIPVIVSGKSSHALEAIAKKYSNVIPMACVSNYPAFAVEYTSRFLYVDMRYLSDHTIDFELFDKVKPEIVEWHFKLNTTTGLDAGPFARTPEQLKVIL